MHKEVNKMKIEITGEPKEIAALVLAVQERQSDRVSEIDKQLGPKVSQDDLRAFLGRMIV